MASKTQMYRLLRLVDFGGNDHAVREAWQCWRALPETTHREMMAAGGADGRRARLWYAAWSGGLELAMEHIDALEAGGTGVVVTSMGGDL